MHVFVYFLFAFCVAEMFGFSFKMIGFSLKIADFSFKIF